MNRPVHTVGNPQWTKTLRIDTRKLIIARQGEIKILCFLAVASAFRSLLVMKVSSWGFIRQKLGPLTCHHQKFLAFPIPVFTSATLDVLLLHKKDSEPRRLCEMKHAVILYSARKSHCRCTRSNLQPRMRMLHGLLHQVPLITQWEALFPLVSAIPLV